MQKLGINIDAMEDFNASVLKSDYKDTIKLIATLGFGAIFSDMTFLKPPEKIAECCSKYSLEYQFIHAPFKNINDIWYEGLNGDQILKTLCDSVDASSRANVPIIVVHVSSGFVPPPISKTGKERFKTLVSYAQNKNVKIAFENLRVPKYLKWAMDTFKDTSSVGFCWDIGHENCFTTGIDFMSLYGDRLLCTHIHDNQKQLGRDLHLIPFDGKIDFNHMAKRLKNSDYKGPLMLEVFSKNEIYDGVTTEQFYTKAYNAAQKIRNLILE
ncbi:MAG: sugar phosphate isomerase/epimerase [Ruminococcaceae bacterium]|nr:sugar phosphate isomerase/epimerase [Oscillospiraceae bacterium]